MGVLTLSSALGIGGTLLTPPGSLIGVLTLSSILDIRGTL